MAFEQLGDQNVLGGLNNQNIIHGEDRPHPMSKEDVDAFMNALALLPQFALMRMPSLFGKATRAMSAVDRLADVASAPAPRMPQSPNAGVPRTYSRLTPRPPADGSQRTVSPAPRFNVFPKDRETGVSNPDVRPHHDWRQWQFPDESKIDLNSGHFSAPVFRDAGLAGSPQPPRYNALTGSYEHYNQPISKSEIADNPDMSRWYTEIANRAYDRSKSMSDSEYEAHVDLARRTADDLNDYLSNSSTTAMHQQHLQEIRNELEAITGSPMNYVDEFTMGDALESMAPEQLDFFYNWLAGL